MTYFSLHNHTHYSNLRLVDCINTPEKLVKCAYDMGLKGVCITDHEALGAALDVEKLKDEYKDKGFKVCQGNEIYLVNDRSPGQKYWHFLIIAKDAIGHKMMRKLSSTAWLNSYYDRGLERVPTLKSELKNVVEEFGRGHLIASSACLGSELDYNILKLVTADVVEDKKGRQEAYNNIVNYIEYCIDLFGDDFYLEVQPALSKEQIAVNKKMKSIADAFGLKIIITTDSHYLRPEDRVTHKAFLTSKPGDREVDEFYYYAYVQTPEEIKEHMKDTGLDYEEMAANTLEIYDKIEYYSLKRKQHVPQVEVKNYPKKEVHSKYSTLDYLYNSDNTQERYWVNQCIDKLKELNLYNDTYLSRLEEEADIQKVIGEELETCMFAYPITLQHYINIIWDCGSTVGAGRGSACAGLNHMLLGITQLDPVKWNLPYFRYLNKKRIELGDIDIDICPSKRKDIFEAIRKERGPLGLVQVCTYGTQTTKSAILTAAKGYRSSECPNGIEVDIAQYMSSLIPSERGFTWEIKDVVHGNKEKGRKPVKQFIQEVNKYPGLLKIIEDLEGLISRRGTHASGVIFYEEDLYETSCIMKSPNGDIVTQYSLHDEESVGSVKYDLLVVEIQDVIVQCLNLLQEHEEIPPWFTLREMYNEYIHPNVLPIEDKKLWDSLNKADILKEFQFEGQVGSNTLKTLKPRTPIEMANCNSIMRLMGDKGQETPSERYERLKEDMSLWYQEMDDFGLTKEEQNILEKYYLPAYGTPSQQEDLMLVLIDKNICGFDLAEANAARKTIAKKKMDQIPILKEKIIKSAKSENLGKYIWKTLALPQCGYAFSVV